MCEAAHLLLSLSTIVKRSNHWPNTPSMRAHNILDNHFKLASWDFKKSYCTSCTLICCKLDFLGFSASSRNRPPIIVVVYNCGAEQSLAHISLKSSRTANGDTYRFSDFIIKTTTIQNGE